MASARRDDLLLEEEIYVNKLWRLKNSKAFRIVRAIPAQHPDVIVLGMKMRLASFDIGILSLSEAVCFVDPEHPFVGELLARDIFLEVEGVDRIIVRQWELRIKKFSHFSWEDMGIKLREVLKRYGCILIFADKKRL
ncbi:MAG: hypothetical protein US76_02030 [Parcubacteria group bacterium GW2011_GWA2_38_13b]|nr:MAG: hypothetical protein US76_02030 [Parcubacteria group bacterium GW2011_GWA2_38_13b]